MAFTFFFRDHAVLEEAANLLVAETMGRSRVRVWDAGCAMGPEPYTVLIMLAERMGKFAFENLHVEATDVDEGGDFGEIVAAGQYSLDHLCRIPKELFAKYFERVEGKAEVYTVSQKLRSKLSFKRHNLLGLVPPAEGYAMIICKNVLLHFSENERIAVINMFHASLAPGGLLVMEYTQKMPEAFSARFGRANCTAPIFRKENGQALAVAA